MKKMVAAALTLSFALAASGCAKTADTATTAPQAENTSGASENSQAPSPSPSEEAEETSETEGSQQATVLSYNEYMAAELDTQVTVEAYVQAVQAWSEEKATVYAQDQDGAYFAYNLACSEADYEKLVPGVKIQITGYKAEWSGETEIMDGSFRFADDTGDTYIAPALDVTELLGTEELIDHQNQFVSFTGMTVEAAGQGEDGSDVAYLYNWDGSGTEGDDLYFNVSRSGETYTFTVESNLCDSSTEVYQAVQALNIGDTVDLQGFLYWYEGLNPHITAVSPAE